MIATMVLLGLPRSHADIEQVPRAWGDPPYSAGWRLKWWNAALTRWTRLAPLEERVDRCLPGRSVPSLAVGHAGAPS